MKALKMILLTAIIAVPLYIAIADPFFGMFQRVNKVAQEDDYNDEDYDDTIDDQEVHIDGFPVIYIEGGNEIEKEEWEEFLADLQRDCNVPWLTKNVSSIHFCSDDVFDNTLDNTLGKSKSANGTPFSGFVLYKDNSVYIREAGGVGYEYTILHEFGHAYDNVYGITTGNFDISVLTSNQKKVCKHANKMGDSDYEYCSSTIQETFADTIQFYITSRNAGLVPEEVFNWIDTLPR